MAEKKKTTTAKKKAPRAPSLNERITDFSTNGYGKVTWTPKKTSKKK